MKVLQTFALPLGYVTACKKRRSDKDASFLCGAEDEARTRYLHLGKVALYQMSYSRMGHCFSDFFIICKGRVFVKLKMRFFCWFFHAPQNKKKSRPENGQLYRAFGGDQNSATPVVRGKGSTSRMLEMPVRYITSRSKPMPNPEWMFPPKRRRSRYHQ